MHIGRPHNDSGGDCCGDSNVYRELKDFWPHRMQCIMSSLSASCVTAFIEKNNEDDDDHKKNNNDDNDNDNNNKRQQQPPQPQQQPQQQSPQPQQQPRQRQRRQPGRNDNHHDDDDHHHNNNNNNNHHHNHNHHHKNYKNDEDDDHYHHHNNNTKTILPQNQQPPQPHIVAGKFPREHFLWPTSPAASRPWPLLLRSAAMPRHGAAAEPWSPGPHRAQSSAILGSLVQAKQLRRRGINRACCLFLRDLKHKR